MKISDTIVTIAYQAFVNSIKSEEHPTHEKAIRAALEIGLKVYNDNNKRGVSHE